MKPRELASLAFALIALATAVVEMAGSRTAEQATTNVDASLRACLNTLEHVIEHR